MRILFILLVLFSRTRVFSCFANATGGVAVGNTGGEYHQEIKNVEKGNYQDDAGESKQETKEEFFDANSKHKESSAMESEETEQKIDYTDDIKFAEELLKIGYDLYQPFIIMKVKLSKEQLKELNRVKDSTNQLEDVSVDKPKNELHTFKEPDIIKCRKKDSPRIYDFKYEKDQTEISLKVACPIRNKEEIKSTHVTYKSLEIVQELQQSTWVSEIRCDFPLIPSIVPTYESNYRAACHLNDVGYQVYFGERVMPLIRWPYTKKEFGWFPVATYCHQTNYMNTIYASEVIFSFHLYSKIKDDNIISQYLKHEHGNEQLLHHLFSVENQEKVFLTLFKQTYNKFFNKNSGLYLEKQELIDQRNHVLPTWKMAALFNMNLAPMYKSIRNGSWERIQKAIRERFIEFGNDITINMFTAVYDCLVLEKQCIYLDPNGKRVMVPYAFYKVITVNIGTEIRSIAVFTHNNPFEKNPAKICNSQHPCETYGFNFTNTNSKEGYTYCCEVTGDFRTKFIYGDKFRTGSPLYLNKLEETIESVRNTHNLCTLCS